jgi:signal transduction histidine kinase/HAMP domain-containing protein
VDGKVRNNTCPGTFKNYFLGNEAKGCLRYTFVLLKRNEKMKTKTRLYLGVGLLFSLIVILSFFAINQINLLASASENIIKDNKETITYTQNMLKVLSEIHDNEEAFEVFNQYLKKQENNITETGEKELTEKLSESFRKLWGNPDDNSALKDVRSYLFEIWEINLNAIDRKSMVAATTAKNSIWLISFISVFCFIISLALFIFLPGNISNPIKELTKSIRQIANENYSQRVSFESHSEFGELAVSFNTMAQKLDEYNKTNIDKLLVERKISETLLNKIQYPIIGFDKRLKITLVNEEFLKIANLEGENLVGENIMEVAIRNDLLRKLLITEPDKENKVTLNNVNPSLQIHVQGKEVFYEKEIQNISYTSHDEGDEHIFGYVIILKNITKFMELDQAKNNFIATVSHELKTPISAIKFSLQLLNNDRTGILNAEQRELIQSCEDDTDHLLKLISEILNFTQVETGKIELNMIPSDLKEIIRYTISITKPIADKKNIRIIEDFQSDPVEVIIDREKTAWVFTNLLSNAIRYSDDHSTVRLSILKTGKSVKISVSDTGHGIDAKYKNKIFERYFRVPGTEKEGTGLGLSICKEFIEAQGGKIMVDSTLGIGSTFSVILTCKSC